MTNGKDEKTMMKNVARALALGTVASLIFYCSAASRGMPDAGAQDAGPSLDGGAPDGDAGADPCVVCPEPEPPCPSCQRFRTEDIQTTVDASAFISVPHWGSPGSTFQAFERVFVVGASYWRKVTDGFCSPVVYTEPPDFAPSLPVPSLYFAPGVLRECRVVIAEPEPLGG